MAATVDDVIAQRFRTQRLTSAPLADPADVVRLLVCVQSQDAPSARFSIGMRAESETDESIRDAINGGRIVRTHILRPTWHYVAPEDLVWLLDLTSAKVEASMAARHRNLGLDADLVSRTHDELAKLLAGRRFLTRRTIAAELGNGGRSFNGEQVGHLLLLAELRGLICSGPLDGAVHTYGLVDELIARQPARDRDDAVRELVARFFAGHGPAAVTDLTRWTKLTQAEIRAARADLGDRLETITVDGVELHADPGRDAPQTRDHRALLLPLFDEAYLTYPKLNVPRVPAHPNATLPRRVAESSGGVVVCDRRDAGWWKRSIRGETVEVSLAVSPGATPDQLDAVAGEARRLATFTGREPIVRFV